VITGAVSDRLRVLIYTARLADAALGLRCRAGKGLRERREERCAAVRDVPREEPGATLLTFSSLFPHSLLTFYLDIWSRWR